MTEPIYVSQTFEPEHLKDFEARNAWFNQQSENAFRRNCRWPRYSITEEGDGLLFEAWLERPEDQGEPRWDNSFKSEKKHRNKVAYPVLWKSVEGAIKSAMNAHPEIKIPNTDSVVKRIVGQVLTSEVRSAIKADETA